MKTICIYGGSYFTMSEGSLVFGFLRDLPPCTVKDKLKILNGTLDQDEFVVHGNTLGNDVLGVANKFVLKF